MSRPSGMTISARIGLTLLLSFLVSGVRCLRNVRLEVTPEKVELGQEASLRCRYELEGVPLYSLKWYRGQHEFYRYSPSETPNTKVFNFTWITVDTRKSNETQVTIKNVDFPLSGNFSCEVTTDAPTFSTASSHRVLTVVSVPKSKPVVAAERDRYEPGNKLRANCSVPASRPPAHLSFMLNDQQVEETKQYTEWQGRKGTAAGSRDNSLEQRQERGVGERQWTELRLTLQPFHFLNGQLNLRCTARIDGVYEETSELRLGAPPPGRDPVPERVTSENAVGRCRGLANLTIAGLLLLQQLLR